MSSVSTYIYLASSKLTFLLWLDHIRGCYSVFQWHISLCLFWIEFYCPQLCLTDIVSRQLKHTSQVLSSSVREKTQRPIFGTYISLYPGILAKHYTLRNPPTVHWCSDQKHNKIFHHIVHKAERKRAKRSKRLISPWPILINLKSF